MMYINGRSPEPSCPAEISFLMDTSATLRCLAVVSEQQEGCYEGTRDWKQKYFHKYDCQ